MRSPAEDCDSPRSGSLEPTLSCDVPTLLLLAASVLVLVVADLENFEGKTSATFVTFDLSHDVFGFEAVLSPTGWPVAIAVVRPTGSLDFEGPWSLRLPDIATLVCVLRNEINLDIRVYRQELRGVRCQYLRGRAQA